MKLNDLFSVLDHAPDVQMDIIARALDILSPDVQRAALRLSTKPG